MPYLCFNGVFSDAQVPVIPAANKAYRYGDGFFETLRVHRASIPLWDLHRNRILRSIALLNYSFAADVAPDRLYKEILELCSLNGCPESARVRLSFSNGNGGLFDRSELHYLIEAGAFAPAPDKGLQLGIYDELPKEVHRFSGIKLANAFIYSRAAQFCSRKGWSDCVILNNDQQVIETSISNLFWAKNGDLFTPPVTDGCVAGVFRSYLLTAEPGITERSCTLETLKEADALFLTNALRGIRKVTQFDGTHYGDDPTEARLHQHNQLLFP